MPRSFVVVGESVAVMTYLSHRFVELDELVGRSALRLRAPGVIVLRSKNRIERILREDVLDVGDEQFLMLLLVMNAENEDRLDFIE